MIRLSLCQKLEHFSGIFSRKICFVVMLVVPLSIIIFFFFFFMVAKEKIKSTPTSYSSHFHNQHRGLCLLKSCCHSSFCCSSFYNTFFELLAHMKCEYIKDLCDRSKLFLVQSVLVSLFSLSTYAPKICFPPRWDHKSKVKSA